MFWTAYANKHQEIRAFKVFKKHKQFLLRSLEKQISKNDFRPAMV